MDEAFYWVAIPTIFLFLLVACAAVFELATKFLNTPFFQAERRRQANERWKEIINE